MKKLLLTGAVVMALSFGAQAQNTCETALTLADGTTTVGEINGTYVGGCWNDTTAPTAAEWYKVTPAVGGAYRINTNLAANAGGDTRISVYTGTCGDLTCWDGSDDVNSAQTGGNYLTDWQFPVEAGETYYIVFDNRWKSTGFDVEVTFTEGTCSTNSLTENWSNIASYYFCWATQDVNADENGWSLSSAYNWDATSGNDNVVLIFSGEEGNDDYLVSSGKNLIGGTTYTVSVKYNGVNTQDNATPPVVTEANQTFSVLALGGEEEYELGTETGVAQDGNMLSELKTNATVSTYTFTPETSGEYSFAIYSNTEAGSGALVVFEVNVTGTMGVATPSVADFSVSPNPANNVVTIANANALVNAVSVTDMNGRVVKTASFDGATQAQVNVSDLANGVYMMTISSDKGSVTKKIVKN